MIFALAGNPNSGKTTLFNALTGSTAHVGNWPGVTVDRRAGYYKKLKEERAEIVDLPGIYSLSPYSPEEVVSRNFLVDDKPDCIINIIDATNLERNLYLTTQLMELDIPIVLALNMTDALEKNKDSLDAEQLSRRLGLTAVRISALKGRGIHELMSAAIEAAKTRRKGKSVLCGELAGVLESIRKKCEDGGVEHSVFHAVKIIEGDGIEVEKHSDIAAAARDGKSGFDTGIFHGDFEGLVADARYKYITSELSPSLKKSGGPGRLSLSAKIDKIATHKYFGIPVFLAVMFLVFHIVFSENFLGLGIFLKNFDHPVFGTEGLNSPGVILTRLMELASEALDGAARGALGEGTWYSGLLVDGVLGGILAVMSFLPQIMTLFLCLSILEDSGYMARGAFLMDKAFRRLGLSGRSFMPMLMCFGCGVPGIMATKSLENEAERRRTIFLAPFFSCGAKLPIWAAFAAAFSYHKGLNAEFVVFSMYLLGIAVAVVASLFLKKTIITGDGQMFIMELPDYRAPQARNTLAHLWDKLKHYLVRAGTIIAGATVVVWFLTSFGFNLKMVEDTGGSILGILAGGLKYIFYPLGFGMGENGWKFVVAVFIGFIAKELVVATMGVFDGAAGGGDGSLAVLPILITIGGTLGGLDVSIPAMFAFMAFNLLNMPCMAAVAAAKGELGEKRWIWKAIAFWTATGYIVALVIFWGGVLFAFKVWIGLLAVAVAVASLTGVYFLKYKRGKRSS